MNAKQELLNELKEHGLKILGARLYCKSINNDDKIWIVYDEEVKDLKTTQLTAFLPLNYSEQEYLDFLNKLDFEYNEGYGGQNLFGYVLLENNCWLERGEYDGSEWWEFKSIPDIKLFKKV